MKKIVSILVVLAMLAAMVPAVFAAEGFSGTIDAVKGEPYTTDTWTATEAGVLTISVSSEEGVGYKVYWNGESQSLGYDIVYSAEVSYQVTAGDEYYLEVKGWNPDSFSFCDASISYSFSFAAGGVVKEAYTISEQVITTEGAYTVEMIDTAEVTIVTLTPEETGVYTISVDEGALIGNYGSGSWWIADQANVEHGTSLEWTCQQVAEEYEVTFEDGTTEIHTSEGQSLMLGIVSDSETVNVTVKKTGDYESEETPLYTYENKAALSQFEVPADATIGDYVDVYGDTHTAVLGEDGYYHLDSADGDILLVDMNHTAVLSDALRSDRPVMYAYVTLEDGSQVKYDIGAAVQAYEAVCDDNGYYPLTEDLIFFYDTYAAGAGVHSFYLEDGYNADCAWMFACLTMALPEEEETVTGSGTEDDPYIINSLPYDMVASFKNDNQAFNGIFYQYTAEKDGSLELKDIYDDYNTGVLSVVAGDEWTMITEGNYEVKAGDVILLCHWAAWAGDYDLTLQYADTTSGGGSEEGGDEGGEEGGDEPTVPDEGEWSGTNVEVAADEIIQIVYTPETDGVLTIDISCATGWQIRVYDDFSEDTVWSDTGESPVSFNLVADTTYTIEIIPYDEADGWTTCDAVMTYALTYSASGDEGGEEGDEEGDEAGTLVDGDNYIELPIEADAVEYTYTATQTGTLYVIATYIGWDSDGSGIYDDDSDCIVDDFTNCALLTVDGTPLENYYYGSVEVVEGETYTFTWTDIAYINWGWEATLNLSYSDELLPVKGSADLPVELFFQDCPTESIEIAAGSEVYYTLYQFTGTTFTVTGEGAYVVVESYDSVTGETVDVIYEAVDGVVEVPISGWGSLTLRIGNGSDSAATYILNAYYPAGSMENPAELVAGENVAEIAESSTYYFNWTAACNGTLTLDISGEYWDYCVNNYGDPDDWSDDSYGDWNNSFNEPVVSKQTIEVKAGDTIEISIGSYNAADESFPATTITVNATIEYAHEPDGEGVHTEGSCTEDSTTTYTCTLCGETYVVVAEDAPGHDFVDGECTVCGEAEVTLGDVNGDGEVNIFDANLIAAYFNEVIDLTDAQLRAADVNGDGDVNIFDANLVAAYYNEVIDAFPVEE